MIDSAEERRKWEFLRDAPTRDALDPDLREVARHLAAIAALSPAPEWCYAQLALALARDCIAYQLDVDRVGREQIDGYTDPPDSPLRGLIRGFDDCDAKARLFVALCLANGLPAGMVDRWKGTRLAHVYGRVLVRWLRETMPRWFFAETILRRARLGDIAESVPKEIETGRWSF
jgi:transglutaminase-like putative cysteine protease